MRKTKILIIGGSPAGATAALTARRHYPEKEVVLVRREKLVSIPCGIPYVFGTIGSPAKNIIPNALLEKEGVKIAVETVESLDLARHRVDTSVGEWDYERLILATGSRPARVPVPGADKDGVCSVLKDISHLEALQKRLQTATQVVVVGCGFIGIEFADEIQKLGGKTVTVLEIAPHCLSTAYDEDFSAEMEAAIQARGVQIRTGVKVAEIQGEERVQSVRLSDGTVIPAEVVILGVGAVPNVDLAQAAGIAIGPTGAIAVDRAMETSHEHVFACGDCAEKVSFFKGRPSPLQLASIATLEARIAGANVYGIRREHEGIIGVWATVVGNLALGTAGLTEKSARNNGYDAIAVVVEGPNRHPGGMPGSVMTRMKLVFERRTGELLGGQVRSGEATGEMINLVSACIQKRMTAEDIALFQMGTHPALTASPVVYHLVNGAEMAIAKMQNKKNAT